MDKKYIARNVPLTQDKYEALQVYRDALEEALGFRVSLSEAVAHAVKTANERIKALAEDGTVKEARAEIERLSLDVAILTQELERERAPKRDER
jgi:ribonuclease HI